jgi:hypothetical protein
MDQSTDKTSDMDVWRQVPERESEREREPVRVTEREGAWCETMFSKRIGSWMV